MEFVLPASIYIKSKWQKGPVMTPRGVRFSGPQLYFQPSQGARPLLAPAPLPRACPKSKALAFSRISGEVVSCRTCQLIPAAVGTTTLSAHLGLRLHGAPPRGSAVLRPRGRMRGITEVVGGAKSGQDTQLRGWGPGGPCRSGRGVGALSAPPEEPSGGVSASWV